ncbi:MAG: hypothetical protein ACUVWV_02680 [Thermodesulfobacteriota bacterium]
MQVRVKLIGLAEVPPPFEKNKERQINFYGITIRDLIDHIVKNLAPELSEHFFNEHEEISSDLAIIVNSFWISGSNRANMNLKENDLIELVSSPG